MGANRSFFFTIAIFLGLSSLAVEPGDAKERFFRILAGKRPSFEQQARDRLLYGAEILYTGDCEGRSRPIRVPGIVWHDNADWAHCFRGTKEPILEQDPIFKRIENSKWEEAKLMMEAVPDVYPKTENLADLIKELDLSLVKASKPKVLSQLFQALRKRYPKGFFLKPDLSFNSDGTFITQKNDFLRSYRLFMRDVRPLHRKLAKDLQDEVSVHLQLKRIPGYEGRILEQLFEDPTKIIVQERLDVVKFRLGPEEYRVHVINGRVLKGATQQRWEDFKNTTSEGIRAAEEFVENLLTRLPEQLRHLCMGLDVVRTRDGKFKVIELNPGGESGYFYPEEDLWITHVLAAYHTGEATELQRDFARVQEATDPLSRADRLKEFFSLPVILSLDEKALTTYKAAAKDYFLSDVAANPKAASTVFTLIRRLKLNKFLSKQDTELLKKNCNQALL